MQEQNLLKTEKIGRLLWRLSIPAITAQLVNMLYNIVDRMYIGHIKDVGPLALTGLGLCFPIIILVTAFCNLIGSGGAPCLSMKLGKQDQKGAEKILGNAFSILLILAVILTACFLVFGEPLLYLFGASENTIPYALPYLRIYVAGSIFVTISLGMNPFISAQGFAKVSMLTTLIGAVTNIILDPIFIFVFDMGVRGAALATIISQCVSAIWVLRFLLHGKDTLHIKKENLRLDAKILFPVVALGMAPFIMTSTESLLNICFNTSLQKYGGDLAVGAMTIMSSAMQMVMLPLQGLAQGAQPITSYNYGAGRMDRVRQSFYMLLAASFLYSIFFWLLNLFVPHLLPSIFAGSEELLDKSAWAARIYLAGICVMGIQIACQQTFVALGQAKISLFLALLRKIILLIPLIYILPNFFEDKVFAVFLAEPISDVLASCTTLILFLLQFRKICKSMQTSQTISDRAE